MLPVMLLVFGLKDHFNSLRTHAQSSGRALITKAEIISPICTLRLFRTLTTYATDFSKSADLSVIESLTLFLVLDIRPPRFQERGMSATAGQAKFLPRKNQ
jgi:hypothetical protein